MNVELLKKTRDYILENPRKHIMTEWLNECGTAGCIAGIGSIISGKPLGNGPFISFEIQARELFGFGYEKRYIARRLFYSSDWPVSIRKERANILKKYLEDGYMPSELPDYASDEDFLALAKITAKRIDRFIETDGAE